MSDKDGKVNIDVNLERLWTYFLNNCVTPRRAAGYNLNDSDLQVKQTYIAGISTGARVMCTLYHHYKGEELKDKIREFLKELTDFSIASSLEDLVLRKLDTVLDDTATKH